MVTSINVLRSKMQESNKLKSAFNTKEFSELKKSTTVYRTKPVKLNSRSLSTPSKERGLRVMQQRTKRRLRQNIHKIMRGGVVYGEHS